MNTVKAERNKVSLVGGEPFDFVLLKRSLWLDGKFAQDNTRKSSLTYIFFNCVYILSLKKKLLLGIIVKVRNML